MIQAKWHTVASISIMLISLFGMQSVDAVYKVSFTNYHPETVVVSWREKDLEYFDVASIRIKSGQTQKIWVFTRLTWLYLDIPTDSPFERDWRWMKYDEKHLKKHHFNIIGLDGDPYLDD